MSKNRILFCLFGFVFLVVYIFVYFLDSGFLGFVYPSNKHHSPINGHNKNKQTKMHKHPNFQFVRLCLRIMSQHFWGGLEHGKVY